MLWMSAPIRFSSQGVGVEAGATSADLHDPGPYLFGRRVDGHGVGYARLASWDDVVAGQRSDHLVVGRAPSSHAAREHRYGRGGGCRDNGRPGKTDSPPMRIGPSRRHDCAGAAGPQVAHSRDHPIASLYVPRCAERWPRTEVAGRVGNRLSARPGLRVPRLTWWTPRALADGCARRSDRCTCPGGAA
jgi:hypothetical protein